jgi:hypothetical protein
LLCIANMVVVGRAGAGFKNHIKAPYNDMYHIVRLYIGKLVVMVNRHPCMYGFAGATAGDRARLLDIV